MRILILVNHDLVIYNFRKELVKEFLDSGHEVIISSPNGSRINLLNQMGARHKVTEIDRHGFNPISEVKLLFHYLKIIDEIKPDIMLSYTIKPNIYGSIAARIKKIPILANVTGLGNAFSYDGLKSKMVLTLYKIALKKTDVIFFQNQENLLFLQKHLNISERSILLPGSGVNLEEFSYHKYPHNKETIITYFGRIMESKGIIDLLKAIEKMNIDNINIKYQFIGFFESDEIKEKFFEFKRRNSNIYYYDHLLDIKGIIADSNAIVLPSHHEGMSNSLLEAAAIGRPLLASNISGCKEIIDDYENGFLFDVASVNSIVEAINKFENVSEENKEIMGKKSRLKVEKQFDRSMVVNEYVNVIKKILGEENYERSKN